MVLSIPTASWVKKNKRTTIMASHISSTLDLVSVQAQMFASVCKHFQCWAVFELSHGYMHAAGMACAVSTFPWLRSKQGAVRWKSWLHCVLHLSPRTPTSFSCLTRSLTYWLWVEEPWEPEAPDWADSDSVSGAEKRENGVLSPRRKKLKELSRCSEEYGFLRFHVKITSRAFVPEFNSNLGDWLKTEVGLFSSSLLTPHTLFAQWRQESCGRWKTGSRCSQLFPSITCTSANSASPQWPVPLSAPWIKIPGRNLLVNHLTYDV